MTREKQIREFLQNAGWGDAVRSPVPGDASTRRYERLTRGADKAVLMDAPKGAEAPSEPEGASVEERRELGYNALARLAGPNPESFTSIAKELTMRGFSAPHILAANIEEGLILLEDLGDDLFARVIRNNPAKERQLYEAAIDTLAAIYRSSFPQTFDVHGAPWRVRAYDEAALQAEANLYLEWFVPDLGLEPDEAARREWAGIWNGMFKALGAHAPGLALRDFHAENLFWMPDRHATSRVGLIDFQDALFAHPAYDLVSLLEDARRDVPGDLAEEMKTRFCLKTGIYRDEAFDTAYAVMAAQRNAKILGIFVRLAKRDGKPHYRGLIPRVAKLFASDLEHPALELLRGWVQKYAPQTFDQPHSIKTAMVMAAGHGTRMKPLTDDRSKAMVEVGGKPLIDHMLDRLKDAGVERAIVNVHAHADLLEVHLNAREGLPKIVISDEREELLETGGGVVKALPLLGHDPVFICNIDAVWLENEDTLKELENEDTLKEMMAAWNPREMDDLLLLAPKGETLGYPGAGDFDLADDGRITRRSVASADYVYAGVQIARLEPIAPFKPGPFSRNKVWDVSLSKDRAYGHVLDGFWMHVGDPQARDEAEEKLSRASGH